MTPRLCYAMDVPRGALLVEHAIVVETVEVVVDEGVVRIGGADGALYRFRMDERVRIDEDTPERQGRLAAARALLWDPERPSRPERHLWDPGS